MIALKIIAILLFGSESVNTIVQNTLWMTGAWKIFGKCGLPGHYALIPCWNYYSIARCADREQEGRVFFVSEIVVRVLAVANLFIPNNQYFYVLQNGFLLAVDIIILIYTIKIAQGLCEVFNARKRWCFLWVVFDFIPALIWGFLKKYQPQWKVQDFDRSDAEYFSGIHAEVMDQGLTINLDERSVMDFFKKKYLLRDIHMNIKSGHMILLLGGSGAGKTTLLNAINGYEKAKAEVILNGKNVYTDYDQIKYEVGFVPQQDLMRGNDTVEHTLNDMALLRLPISFSKDERRARVEEVMKIFGLTPVKDNQVEKLSGGQRKRLSIAMEFLSNPSLFILDEPDSGLDGVMARELMQQLRMIADQGKIVIVITHTPDRVADLFDDVIVLAKDTNRTGRLAYFGNLEEARNFFGKEKMEEIVRSINRQEEGGEGRADEFVKKFAEAQYV